LRGLGRREVRNLLEKTRGKIESSPKQGKKAKRRR